MKGGFAMGKTKKERVAAYCRVSTEKDEQLASLENQKKFFEEYASLHNYEIVEVYADEGISGTKLKNRKAFVRMMQDARNGRFTRVFVKDISRFARNAVDFLQSIRELKAMGIKCDFVNAGMSTEDGEFVLGLLALVAQEESANISKRVKFSKHKNAEKGRVPNIVYGYDKTCGELFTLKINEFEANVIRRIYSMYITEGYGGNKIAQILNAEGLTTKRNCRWTQNTVCYILQNPIYIGKVINGREEVRDFLTGTRVRKDENEWQIVENEDLRIIDDETFWAAGRLLLKHKEQFKLNNIRQSNRYPFSTLIKCTECGYSFRRIKRDFKTKPYIKWGCSSRNAIGKDFCHNRILIDEAELTDEIRKYLIELVNSGAKLKDEIIRHIRNELSQKYEALDEGKLKSELDRLKRVKRKQTEMYEVDAISLKELKERTYEINQNIKDIEEKLRNFNPSLSEKSIENLVNKYCKNAETLLSAEVMDNALLRQVIEKILVYPDGKTEVYLKIYSDINI